MQEQTPRANQRRYAFLTSHLGFASFLTSVPMSVAEAKKTGFAATSMKSIGREREGGGRDDKTAWPCLERNEEGNKMGKKEPCSVLRVAAACSPCQESMQCRELFIKF